MKKYFYLACLFVLGITFASCEDENGDDVVRKYDYTFKFVLPSEVTLGGEDVVKLNSLEFKEKNTGLVTSVSAFTEGTTNATCSLAEGLYTVNMEATIDFKDESVSDFFLSAYNGELTLTASQASSPIEMECFTSPSKGGFVLAEIFFIGTKDQNKKNYMKDKYFRIYNNSKGVLCADGLTIAESAFQNTSKKDYTPMIIDSVFAAQAIYRIPLGSNIMVKPGESLILCDVAKNHKEVNPNSFDLSKADFEWYDESTNETTVDEDTPVPNLEKIYCYTATIWTPVMTGSNSYVLARLGDSFENQLTKEEYLANDANKMVYNYNINPTLPGKPKTTYSIPNKWILDAVNLSVKTRHQWNVTDPSLDKGWSYCVESKTNDECFKTSVRRKVASGKTLQDTNNSTEDFLPAQAADPYFQF